MPDGVTAGKRHKDKTAELTAEAEAKFPNGWDANAQTYEKHLKSTNKNRAFKTGTLEHFLLHNFFPQLKSTAAGPSQSEKNATPTKPSSGKGASAKENDANDVARDPASELARSSADSELADAASHSSSSEGEDASVRSVAGKPATPVERRAAADDAPLSEIAARAGAGLADDDNLLGAGSAADNHEDANVEAAQQAERRLEKKASENQKKASENQLRRSDKPKPRGRDVESDEDDEVPIFHQNYGKKKAVDKDSKKTVEKESKKRKRSRNESETSSAEEISDSDEKRPSRYKPRKVSALLNDWDFDLIRPEFQRLALIRDGAEIRDGAPMRVFNMHLVLAAAAGVLPRDTFKRFKKSVMESRGDKDDM